MLKKTLLFLSCFFVALTILSFSVSTQKPEIRIIVDAGHGGKDPGAPGLTSTEAEISLDVAKKLGPNIEKEISGVKVLYTRTTDIIPGNKPDKDQGNRYRASFANSSGADLFISIHCNSAGKAPGGWYEKRIVDYNEKVSYKKKGKKKVRVVTKVPVYSSFYVHNVSKGTETYIWTAKENSHKGEMVGNNMEFGEAEDNNVHVPENDPVINALKLAYTKKFFLNSLRLATLVQDEFQKSGRINRGVKQRNEKGIWVLHATGMPSILVELGFISNKEEEAYMISDAGQEEMVNNITAAVKNYLDLVKRTKSEKDSSHNRDNGKPFAFLREPSVRKMITGFNFDEYCLT